MAATSTTAELATMPNEIICMIGDNMSVREVKDWTLVSKQFREILLPKLCKHLKFSGNMKEFTNSLNAYFARKTASFRHLARHQARFVTFEVTSFNDTSAMRAWVQRYGDSTIPIRRFLADTTSLHGVIFDIWFSHPKEAFSLMSLIRRGADWHGPKHLYFKNCLEHYDMGKIIGKFNAWTLEGISAPITSWPKQYDELARNGANLTSLRLDRKLCSPYVHDVALVGLEGGLAARINKSFPYLESLNIYEEHFCNGIPVYWNDPRMERWFQEITTAAFFLADLRPLRRFAFTMGRVESNDVAINSITKQLLPIMENQGLVTHEVHGLEGVYRLATNYLAAYAKSLEEICLTNGYHMFYRATLTDGVWNMSEESYKDPSQKYLFPNGLGN